MCMSKFEWLKSKDKRESLWMSKPKVFIFVKTQSPSHPHVSISPSPSHFRSFLVLSHPQIATLPSPSHLPSVLSLTHLRYLRSVLTISYPHRNVPTLTSRCNFALTLTSQLCPHPNVPTLPSPSVTQTLKR